MLASLIDPFLSLFQVDAQLQEQLFKLYHNERDIERLSEEVRGKQKDLEKMVSQWPVKHSDLALHGMYTCA